MKEIDKLKKDLQNTIYKDVDIIDYVSAHDILVNTKYGLVKTSRKILLSNSEIKQRSALNKELFLEEKIKDKLSRNELPYKIIKYYNTNKVICKNKYGYFKVPINLLYLGHQGDNQTAIYKTQYFINLANEIHNHKYDYSKSVFKHSLKKLKIICKFHGEFYQTSSEHIHKEHGCKNCKSAQSYRGIIKRNPKQKTYVYISELKLNHELFYKIGLKCSLKNYREKRVKPYIWQKTLVCYETTALTGYLIEQTILKKYVISYKPLIKFGGFTECFIKTKNEFDLQNPLKTFKKIINTEKYE